MDWEGPLSWRGEKRRRSDELCRRGVFRHMMSPNQRKFHELLDQPGIYEAGLFCSRKFGKSFSAFLYEMELCMRGRNVLVRHVMGELKQCKDVLFKVYDELKEFVPMSVLPTLIKSEASFYFPATGSYILLGGTKPENIESSRGPRANHLALDEVASFDASNYDYALESVLFPQLSTTAGKIAHYTTPPESPQHPWIAKHYAKMLSKGSLLTFDFDQNDVLTENAKLAILERYTTPQHPSPRDNPGFRREYLCELIANIDRRVVPEFDVEQHVYKGDPLAPFRDERGPFTNVVAHISGDHGIVDNTVLLLGYVDWRSAILYITKEIVLRGKDECYLSNLAAVIRELQQEAVQHSEELVTQLDCFDAIRVSLMKDHGITAVMPTKHNLEGGIGVARTALTDGKVQIHESCRQLITELTYSMWKTSESDVRKIERTDLTSHSDALMSFVYMLRRVSWTRRPGSQKTLDLGGRRR